MAEGRALIDIDTAVRAVKKAEDGMPLSRMAALLMSRYGARGATDVTSHWLRCVSGSAEGVCIVG